MEEEKQTFVFGVVLFQFFVIITIFVNHDVYLLIHSF